MLDQVRLVSQFLLKGMACWHFHRELAGRLEQSHVVSLVLRLNGGLGQPELQVALRPVLNLSVDVLPGQGVSSFGLEPLHSRISHRVDDDLILKGGATQA